MFFNKKKAERLAKKIERKIYREERKKTKEFQNLVLHKIKKEAKEGGRSIGVYAPQDYMVIAITSLKSRGFEVDHFCQDYKRYMKVEW